MNTTTQTIQYDYANQAWVIDGIYQACNHPKEMDCNCYGTEHAGEPALLCEQCSGALGNDLMALFTTRQVCRKCVDRNHKGVN